MTLSRLKGLTPARVHFTFLDCPRGELVAPTISRFSIEELVIENLLVVIRGFLSHGPPDVLAALAVAMDFPKMRQSWLHSSVKTVIRVDGSSPAKMMNLSQPRVSANSLRATLTL